MKKIILVIAIFILSNCEIKVRETNAQSDTFLYTYANEAVYKNGMEYSLFYARNQSSQTGYCVAVVNITKDKLETEKLELEIQFLKKQLSDTIKTNKNQKHAI